MIPNTSICRRSNVTLNIVALFMATALPAVGQTPSTPSPARAEASASPYSSVITTPNHAATIQQGRDIILDFMKAEGIPGASVAAAIDGVPVWAEGFGLADVEQGVPVTTSTRFRSGSIAKPMTQVAGAVLRDQGLLDYDAPIQRYLPDFPRQNRPITYRMLAGHLAGFRHYDPVGEEFFNHTRYQNIEDAFEPSLYSPLLSEPGDEYRYSSLGTHLQGMVIQAAGGADFLSLMQTRVFAPLGMLSTQGDRNEEIIMNRTRYYERSDGKPQYRLSKLSWGDGKRGELRNAPYTDNSNKFPAGGFITTPSDLVRFGSALLQPGFLNKETLTLMFTPQRTRSGKETGYGMNWFIDKDEHGHSLYWHSGSSVGGKSLLLIYPEEKLVLAMQVNLTNADLNPVPRKLATLFLP